MAALLKPGGIVGNRNLGCGCTFDAEAVALQVSSHGHPQRDAGVSVGREGETSGQRSELGGELPLFHLVFRA